MEKFKLKLETREASKPNQLRRDGKIPATVYGPGSPSVNVQLNEREFSRLPAAAYSHIIELEGGPDKKAVAAIIRHVQRKHTTQEVLNVEFYRVAADRKVTMQVPLRFVGESPAVAAGGQLIEGFAEAEVECLPGDIPDFLEVDVAMILEIEQGIHFSQLKLPQGVTVLNPPEELVARVIAKKASVEDKKEAAAATKAPAAAAKAPAAPAAAKAPAAKA